MAEVGGRGDDSNAHAAFIGQWSYGEARYSRGSGMFFSLSFCMSATATLSDVAVNLVIFT